MKNEAVLGVIPARYASQRFPGKPLANILGKPMIQWVYERAKQAQLLSDVIVATDDERIFQAVENFGGKVEMTPTQINNGTERVALIAEKHHFPIIVNIQGDEPLIDPKSIDIGIRLLLDDPAVIMGTLVKKIENAAELANPNLPKVVLDHQYYALYFSRAIIPFNRDQQQGEWLSDHPYYRHLGLYVYRNEFLQKYVRLPESSLERIEKLEQLRVLEHGYRIKAAIVDNAPRGVDTPEDLELLIKSLKKSSGSATGDRHK